MLHDNANGGSVASPSRLLSSSECRRKQCMLSKPL